MNILLISIFSWFFPSALQYAEQVIAAVAGGRRSGALSSLPRYLSIDDLQDNNVRDCIHTDSEPQVDSWLGILSTEDTNIEWSGCIF